MNSTFRLFERICVELSTVDSFTLSPEDLFFEEAETPLASELRTEFKTLDTSQAIDLAIHWLQDHFASRGSSPPFDYDPATGRIDATDAAYIDFIDEMRNIRTVGANNQIFEVSVTNRLGGKLTGELKRVGWRRDVHQLADEFNDYLQGIGFVKNVAIGRKEKDGGLDILWRPPFAAQVFRPIISIQCKNGLYDREVANASIADSRATLDCLGGLLPDIHLYCVLFNDYIVDPLRSNKTKRLSFVPLGLSDLATALQPMSMEIL